MNIKDFKYAWRYTDSKYALFSSVELSKMNVLLEDESSILWDQICDTEIFEKSSYITKILNKSIAIYISDCGWGDGLLEDKTKNKLVEFFDRQVPDKLYLFYDRVSALNVSSKLFCDKWSDFCYPSDSILILSDSKLLIYYEDVLYGPLDI